jgi:hypothetical protein
MIELEKREMEVDEMRFLMILLAIVLVGEGVAEVKLTDAYIKMGNVHATVEASAQNQTNETAEVAIKAYFYGGTAEEDNLYIADNHENVIVAPGSKTEVKVAILYPHGAFTNGKVEIYLNGQLARTIESQ